MCIRSIMCNLFSMSDAEHFYCIAYLGNTFARSSLVALQISTHGPWLVCAFRNASISLCASWKLLAPPNCIVDQMLDIISSVGLGVGAAVEGAKDGLGVGPAVGGSDDGLDVGAAEEGGGDLAAD